MSTVRGKIDNGQCRRINFSRMFTMSKIKPVKILPLLFTTIKFKQFRNDFDYTC